MATTTLDAPTALIALLHRVHAASLAPDWSALGREYVSELQTVGLAEAGIREVWRLYGSSDPTTTLKSVAVSGRDSDGRIATAASRETVLKRAQILEMLVAASIACAVEADRARAQLHADPERLSSATAHPIGFLKH